MKPWAQRMDRVGFSATVKMAQQVREDRAKGVEVFDFTVGEPHWDSPVPVRDAVKEGLDKGLTRYSDSKGLPALRKALADVFKVRGIETDDANILVTPGGKQAIYMACQALLDEGDEAIVIPPCWVSYADIVKLAGGIPVEVNTHARDKYRPTEAALRAAITPRTKLIMTNNPSNPTGAVWEPEVVELVARIAKEHDLWIVDDLVYEVFNYTGRPVPAVGCLAPERTLTIGSFSKSHAMTGYRVGYVQAPPSLVPQLLKLQQQSVTCLPAFVQQGALAALEQCQDFPGKMANHFQDLTKVVRECLGDLDPGPLEGAFYAFVDIKGMDSVAFSDRLYAERRVAVVPGVAFGSAGQGYVRVSYATDEAKLREGLGRLAAAVREWAPAKV
jgi:aspartate/methionine/tyrosine aminotransferase